MIRNEITYTLTGTDGVRYENKTILDRPYSLTHRGAEIILRCKSPAARFIGVSGMAYEAR